MARQNRSLSMGFTDIEPKNPPTNAPTNEGANEATSAPTNEQTNQESIAPTNEPTNLPTNERTHVPTNERTYQPSESRKRYSFDLRPSVHKALKTECVLGDLNMYEVVENLIMQWVEERRRERGQQ